jgi:hypothetical protein
VEDDGVKRRAVSSQLQATRAPARHMVEDDAARSPAVPRQLVPAVNLSAWRMVEASAAGRRTASS